MVTFVGCDAPSVTDILKMRKKTMTRSNLVWTRGTLLARYGLDIIFCRYVTSIVKATGRRLSDLLHGRQRTEPLGLDCKDRIKLATKVFQRDDRSELHQLLVRKMPLEAVEKTIGDPLVCVGHPLAKLQRQFFT